MKVWIVFKVKDMHKRNKQFIVDSVYTTKLSALVREERIHQYGKLNLIPLRAFYNQPVEGILKTPYQQTYIINKSLKGDLMSKLFPKACGK